MHKHGTQLPSIMDKCQASEEGASAGFPEEVKTHGEMEIHSGDIPTQMEI